MRFLDIFSAGGSVGMDAVGGMALDLVGDLIIRLIDYVAETLPSNLTDDGTSGRGESLNDDYHDGERQTSLQNV